MDKKDNPPSVRRTDFELKIWLGQLEKQLDRIRQELDGTSDTPDDAKFIGVRGDHKGW